MLGCNRLLRSCRSIEDLTQTRKVVSLGGWCGPALILGKMGLRTEAYPLDFSRCTLDGVIHFVKNGFGEGFYPPGPPPFHPECVGPWILYRGQHTAFAHFDLNKPEVQAHFEVKFQRFRAIIDEPQHPITFMRTVVARHPMQELQLAQQLEAALHQRNPNLNFEVIYVVHEQGLVAPVVQLAPLSARSSLWTISYDLRQDPDATLFDRTQSRYEYILRQQLQCEGAQPPLDSGSGRPRVGLANGLTLVCDDARRVLLSHRDEALPSPPMQHRVEDVSYDDCTVSRFPWLSHDNLALIEGIASVGGTCIGVGSTEMLVSSTIPGCRKCRYCGNADMHSAATAAASGALNRSLSPPHRPFTQEEDELLLVHLCAILTGEDKVETVEAVAHELKRTSFEVIARIQFLTNSSTKIMD